MNNGRSSKGRTFDSDSKNEGSTPSLPVKYCGQCKKWKDFSEFGKRGNKLQPWCRLCKSKWDRNNYKLNKNNRRKQIEKRRKEIRNEIHLYLFEYFLENHCVDCGNSDIRTLEFDHLSEKEFNIGAATSAGYSLKRIKKEIDKCQVVCANCHKIRTNIRNNSWRNARFESLTENLQS